jgi:hypothetical protein
VVQWVAAGTQSEAPGNDERPAGCKIVASDGAEFGTPGRN